MLQNKKGRTQAEQAALNRLYMEQQKIVFSGKLIPTIPGQHAQGITFVSYFLSYEFNRSVKFKHTRAVSLKPVVFRLVNISSNV